jgi:structure-specific endonuclease subunit SLX1
MTDNRGGGAGPSLGAFHACYLVGSLDPSMKGRSYVGFTVNPERRIRQHNGVLASGAKYTRRLRPCEMVLLVHGFPSKVQALQFEWAWQKPALSRAVRDAARRLKVSDRSSSLANKTRLVMAMLHVSPWRNLPLRVHFLNPTYAKLARDKCDAPPEHVEISTGDMDALKHSVGGSFSDGKDLDDGEEEDFQDGGGEGRRQLCHNPDRERERKRGTLSLAGHGRVRRGKPGERPPEVRGVR